MIIHAISVVLLLFIAVLCTTAVFWEGFDDNLLERIGLGVIATWCTLRASTIYVASSDFESAFELLLYAGLASFVAGAAIEKLKASKVSADDRQFKLFN